ncbi:MAG: hypothetical protein K0M64_03350 [Rhizobium sp.]|nr:hypothetical protein [Rhizobium sp.]
MRKNPLVAGLAGALVLVSSLAMANEPAVVLATNELPVLHRIQGEPGEWPEVEIPPHLLQPMQGYGSAGIVGGALGGAIGAAIVAEQIIVARQQAHDLTLAPLTDTLDKAALESMLRDSFRAALAGLTLEQQALAYFSESRPDPDLLKRLKAARSVENFVLVGSINIDGERVDLPLALDPGMRQLRLALDIELRSGTYDRNRRESRRDVIVYNPASAPAEFDDLLAALAADDHARLRAEIDLAVRNALRLAAMDRDMPKVRKDDVIGALGEFGLTEFNGALLSHEDGQALVWTRDEALVLIPATEILTGEALVAAREAEARRKAEAAAATEAAEAGETAGAEAGTEINAEAGAE